jgi:exosortase
MSDMGTVSTDRASEPIGWPNWLALVLPLACVLAIFWPLFPELAEVWESDPNYSHGLMVVLASVGFAYLAYRRDGWPARETVTSSDFSAGLFQIAFGLLLHLAMWFVRNLFLDVVALICVLRGLLMVWGGADARRSYSFPALFLLFMAPLPVHWYQPFAVKMQQLVSVISTGILSAFGVPVYREGYFIYLPGYTLEVAEACSGLRQLVAILALGVAIGHLSGRGARFSWILGLLAIPIAIIANCIRVVLSGFILMAFGREWAEGVFHTLQGLVIIALSAGLLVLAAGILGRWEDRKSKRADAV